MHTDLADRIARLHPSPIRDILHVIDKPGMVSFAGGLPAPESFPSVASIDLSSHLQYGPSEGESDLREWIAHDLLRKGIKVSPDRVLILSGSQQGIDLVAKLFINSGTTVGVESPTYLAALQVFSLFGATYRPFEVNNLRESLTVSPPRFVYSIPTFQNPTGHVYSTEQRQALADVCDDTGMVLFEDDPYRELAFDACDRTPICSVLTKAPWIYQSSFSKTIAPGMRLGYMTCSESLYPHLLQLKQAADLHSNRLSQKLVLSILSQPNAALRLQNVIDTYKTKRDHFDELLRQHLGDLATWSLPSGGLFFWLTLKTARPKDTRTVLKQALTQNVAFMPGEPFYSDSRDAANCLRLNYSHADPQRAAQGIRTLAELLS